MIESMEWFRLLIENHRSIEYLIIVFGTALGGEAALFVLGFLAAQGIFSIFPIVFFSFLGAFLPNALWFLLGKVSAIGRISSHRHSNATFSIITEAVRRVSKGSHLTALIIIKFLVGTPVLLVMYTTQTSLPLKEFIYYQGVATFLSILVIMPMGYFSGRGFSYLTDIFENLYAAIGFLLLVLLAIAVFQVWIEKKLTSKVENLNL